MKKIAILGFGTIGQGLAKVIEENSEVINKQCNDSVEIKYILDLREFPDHPLGKRVVHDFDTILNDPEITVVVEMMGGSHPAYDFSLAALKSGKNVVTSNKEVVANFGPELLKEAAKSKCRYLFEASVGGGIPIIRTITESLSGNEICEINGILNGTTNYILTEMKKNNSDMETVLKKAQELGYAERDPSADIDGIDACRKICILTALASGQLVSPDSVPTEGIRNITKDDIAKAEENGKVLKLIAHSQINSDGTYDISVKPTEIDKDNPLAFVDGVFNAIMVTGKSLGDIMLYGAGAGSLPTASAVLADVIDIIKHEGNQPAQQMWSAK